MKSIAVITLCITAVELINLEQFSDELVQYAPINNYDVAFKDWTEPFLDKLIKNVKLPKTICSSSCGAFGRSRVLYFLQNISDSTKNFTACLKSHVLPIIFHRNSSNAIKAVQRASTQLRKLRIAKAIHIIYHPLSLNLTLIPYGYLPVDEPNSIANLMTPSASTNLHGYVYKVHYTKLYPFLYHKYAEDGSYAIGGLDHQLTQTIATHQNATIHYGMDPRSHERYPSIEPSVDFNIRRSGNPVVSPDRLYLPNWDGVCVVVPKRHERPVMLQFTKPFLPSVWILVLSFFVARFFFRFNRWRLLLLAVVLIEFMLTASYEVKVIEYMATLRYAPNPRTMIELIDRGEQFVVGPAEVEFLLSFGTRIKIKVTDLAKDTYLGKAAMLYFCLTAESLINTKMNYNPLTNDRIVILLPERLSPYPTSFGFVDGHPLRERFERMLGWAFESGIWRKIYDQFATEEQQFQPLVAPNEYLIEFGDFEPLWMVCGVGWGLALGTFVVEKYWARP